MQSDETAAEDEEEGELREDDEVHESGREGSGDEGVVDGGTCSRVRKDWTCDDTAYMREVFKEAL